MPRTSPRTTKRVTHADVRMYRMGTGDCFVISFFAGKKSKTPTFKMMIDCGTWQGTKARLKEYIADLMEHVGEKVDVLVVTHEHKDHVYGFHACQAQFPANFANEVWMAWSEDDDDGEVKEWKREHGKKARALATASQELKNRFAKTDFSREHGGRAMTDARNRFADSVSGFSELNYDGSTDPQNLSVYAGGLKGMEKVKKKLGKRGSDNERISYMKPGQVLEDIPGLDGIRIYILGPPKSWGAIRKEDSKKEGESYEHSRNLSRDSSFMMALIDAHDPDKLSTHLPFENHYEACLDSAACIAYENDKYKWRTIDDDWLMAAGPLALRLNTGINNLSLVFAIEFVKSGRVMLFPGDAEYGSWKSWHEINWKHHGADAESRGKHLTEDLLNRTVFYKVAHHLSHNGTAKRLGLDMMTHSDLTAMATLDYDVISTSWKGTMPNRFIIKDLLERTRGRLIIMNEEGLPFDENMNVAQKVKAARKRLSNKEKKVLSRSDSELYHEFRVEGN